MMNKEKIKIKSKRIKVRNLDLMNAWQSGMMRTKVIPNKKKKNKKFNLEKDLSYYPNILVA